MIGSFIYIYIYREREREREAHLDRNCSKMARFIRAFMRTKVGRRYQMNLHVHCWRCFVTMGLRTVRY